MRQVAVTQRQLKFEDGCNLIMREIIDFVDKAVVNGTFLREAMLAKGNILDLRSAISTAYSNGRFDERHEEK